MLRLEGLNLALDFSYEYSTRDLPYITHCNILTADEEILGNGTATCSQSEKRVVKEKGRKVAMKKALYAASFDRPFRTLVWKAYFNRFPMKNVSAAA